MFGGLHNIVFTDYSGTSNDLQFIIKADWLLDSAVNNYIYEQRGRWKIKLVFTYVKEPYQFICRSIDNSYETLQKAETAAAFYNRTAQRDFRGTLNITQNDFNINFN